MILRPAILLGEKTVEILIPTHHLPALLLLVLFRQHTGSERRSGSILDSIARSSIRHRGGSVARAFRIRVLLRYYQASRLYGTGDISSTLGGGILLALL